MSGAAELERRDLKKGHAKLRTPCTVPSKTINWVENLPCFDEIVKMMFEGVSTKAIAQVVTGRGYTVGLGEWAVYDRLHRYKKERIDVYKKIEKLGGKQLAEKFSRMSQQLDELEELNKLYEMQKKRLDKMVQNESSSPIPFSIIDDMIIVAMRVLESSSSLKQDLGINPTAPLNINVTSNIEGRITAIADTRFGKESLGKVLSDPVKRSKVASIAEKLLSNPKLQLAVLEKLGKQPEATEDEPLTVETTIEEKDAGERDRGERGTEPQQPGT